MRTFFLVCSALGVATSLWAQKSQEGASPPAKSAKPELPSGPLLRPAPEFSQWEVTYSYADEQKPEKSTDGKPKTLFTGADARLRKVVTTKTGQIVHEEQTDLANRKFEVWFNGSTQYGRGGDSAIWFEAHPGASGGQNFDPLPTNGFRRLDWITADNFAGIMTYGNTACLIFVPGGASKLDLSDSDHRVANLNGVSKVAYIDKETRLPIAVRASGELRTYRFYPEPTQMQSLPADLASQVRKGDEGRARLYAPAPRPY